MKIALSLKGCLSLHVIDTTLEVFERSSIWKLRLPLLRRFPFIREKQALLFPDVTDTQQLLPLYEELQDAARWGLEVVDDDLVHEAVQEAEGELEKKKRVGVAIKAKDPMVCEAYQQFVDVVNREMVRPLCEQQMWDAFFMSTMEKSANFSVPGSGKTAAALGSFSYLRSIGKVSRVLVICPLSAFGSWADEWTACFGERLSLSVLSFQDAGHIGISAGARKRALTYDFGRYNLITINYEAGGLTDELAAIASEDTLLVFDEVHKVKMVGGVRAERALKIASQARYVIALSGTPIPNSYLDIYNMLHILYPREYSLFFGFTHDYLKNPDQCEIAHINASLRPFFCRTSKATLGVPKPEPDHIVQINASLAEERALRQLRRALRGDPLALIVRIMQLESDPSMLLSAVPIECFDSLLDAIEDAQFAKISGEVGSGVELKQMDIVREGVFPSNKTARCVKLVKGLVSQGKPVLVWCVFRKSMSNICKFLQQAGIRVDMVFGDVEEGDRRKIIRRFRAGELDVLVTNPQTLAESVSLHDVCHDAVYFEYGYNLVHLLQSKDRINRLGLPDNQYTQYHFLQVSYSLGDSTWSLGKNIYDRLKEKEQTMLNAIDGDALESGFVDDVDIKAVLRGLSLENKAS